MKKQCLVLTMALFLTACATTENYNLAAQSWVGAPAERLTRVWGYPNRTERLANGNQLYVYKEHRVEEIPVTRVPGQTVIEHEHHVTIITKTPSHYVGGEVYDYRCTTNFEINRRGIVVAADFRGNDCVATKDYAISHANPANLPKAQ